MKSIIQPYDCGKALERIRARVAPVLNSITIAPAPNKEGMLEVVAQHIEEYVSELVRTCGCESKSARESLYSLHEAISVMAACGIVDFCGVEQVDDIMQDIVYDELRRCGVRKLNGYFEPER